MDGVVGSSTPSVSAAVAQDAQVGNEEQNPKPRPLPSGERKGDEGGEEGGGGFATQGVVNIVRFHN